MTVLSVNLNKIALLRNSRGGNKPALTWAASTAVAAGAGGLTLHPRPDLRHALAPDVAELAALIDSSFPEVELNVEGNPYAGPMANGYPGFMDIIRAQRPTQCTLVPDTVAQLTSDHGFDLRRDAGRLVPIVQELAQLGVRSSLFMDPDLEQLDRAAALGVDRIELYTGPYATSAKAAGSAPVVAHRAPYFLAARHCQKIGLGVNAGHDLDLHNLAYFLQIPNILEVSIGHALMVDAMELGLFEAVRRYSRIADAASGRDLDA